MRTPRSAHLLSLFLLGTLTAIGCNDSAGPESGEVGITLTVTGIDLDPDGYVVSVDGAPASTLPGAGSADLNLDAGEHTIVLEGLAANCGTIGPSSHTLTVYPNETAELAFAVRCTAATGIVEVRIVTNGPDPDTDGYQLTLDAGASKGVLPTSLTLFALVPGGSHSLSLTESAPNCSTVGPNPLEVSVEVGGLVRDVAHVAIYVSCTAMTGVIEVRAPTSGFDADADGYDVRLDGGDAQGLSPNGVLRFTGVTGGTHSVSISHLAPNCLGVGANSQEVIVGVGGAVRDTAHVSFAVNCTSTTGAIRVTASTTGQSPDPAYLVRVDGGTPMGLATGATLVIQGLAPGNRSILLLDVASNCEVSDLNPATATVVVGDTVDVQFNVTCTLEPRTSGVDVALTTTGTSPDDAYYLSICVNGDWYCYYPSWSGSVPANGSVEIEIPAGSYYYFFGDVAENCTGGPTSGAFSVASGQVITLTLNFVCAGAGTVVVSAPTSGIDVDADYWVSVDGNYKSGLTPGSSVSLTLVAGTRVIGLEDIAPNCAVSGFNPVSVDVVEGATINVTFPVTCAANPILRTTVSTTGPNAPATYLVGVDPYYYYTDYYVYSAFIPSNGTVSITLPQGSHTVVLDQVPPNCTVTSPNNLSVNLTLGTTTDVVFAVTCT